MQIMADLHIHSRYARACSKQINIENLEKYARIKGLNLLGTGDFTHPSWVKEVKEKLEEDENGILWTKNKFPFIWQTEISLVYSQGGRGRRIHHLVLAPSYEIVRQITDALLKKGRVDYDGRPIFGMSSIEFVDMLMNISKEIEIISAHSWTPWFGIFGSKSGFDSVEECFGDRAKYIHALETGLSSDPEMNWRLSKLDKYSLVSFSDIHSFWPWRMGREATIFDIDLKYKGLIDALRTRKGLAGTIEVSPSYGKYHYDGHRNCNISLSPEESKKLRNICPKCRQPLTIGVMNRVEELADRPAGFVLKNAPKFYRLIPLSEIIAAVLGKGIASKDVWAEYYKIIKDTNEFDILLNKNYEDLTKLANEKLAKAVIDIRQGNINVKPGYDGVYGKLIIDNIEISENEDETSENNKNNKIKNKISQKSLADF